MIRLQMIPNCIARSDMGPISLQWEFANCTGTTGSKWIPTFFDTTIWKQRNWKRISKNTSNMSIMQSRKMLVLNLMRNWSIIWHIAIPRPSDWKEGKCIIALPERRFHSRQVCSHSSLLQKGFRLTLALATPDEALATSALLVQDDLVLMMKNDGTFSSIKNSKCAILTQYRRRIPPRRSRRLSSRLLAPQGEIPHVPRYASLRSWRSSLCGQVTKGHE